MSVYIGLLCLAVYIVVVCFSELTGDGSDELTSYILICWYAVEDTGM